MAAFIGSLLWIYNKRDKTQYELRAPHSVTPVRLTSRRVRPIEMMRGCSVKTLTASTFVATKQTTGVGAFGYALQ